MNKERLMKVLVSPRISEKASTVADAHNQFVFQVQKDATKPDIKAAVELMFDVKVDSVTVCNVQGKRKAFRQKMGRRPGFKKAYVKLKPGYDIDFLGAQ